jgi:hypothetical protein
LLENNQLLKFTLQNKGFLIFAGLTTPMMCWPNILPRVNALEVSLWAVLKLNHDKQPDDKESNQSWKFESEFNNPHVKLLLKAMRLQLK